jgi:hypothetical protein
LAGQVERLLDGSRGLLGAAQAEQRVGEIAGPDVDVVEVALVAGLLDRLPVEGHCGPVVT